MNETNSMNTKKSNQDASKDAEQTAGTKDARANNTSTQKPLLIDQLFAVWERNTSAYFEKFLRNPNVLESLGQVMNAGYKNKIYVDKTLHAMWKNLGLPNKRDQERTLHLLNELHSRIHDLEDQLATLKQKNHEATAGENATRPTGTKAAPQKSATSGVHAKPLEETSRDAHDESSTRNAASDLKHDSSKKNSHISGARTNSTRSNA